MSALGSNPDGICSLRAFPLLTPSRHQHDGGLCLFAPTFSTLATLEKTGRPDATPRLSLANSRYCAAADRRRYGWERGYPSAGGRERYPSWGSRQSADGVGLRFFLLVGAVHVFRNKPAGCRRRGFRHNFPYTMMIAPRIAVFSGEPGNRIVRPGREWSHPRRRDEVAHLRLLLDAPDNAQ